MKTSDTTTLHVRTREQLKKKAQKLLIDKLVPANIFGQNKASEPISVPAKEFIDMVNEHGDSGFFYVEGEGITKTPVMISEIQTDSLTGAPIHIALQRINMNQKVVSEVAIELIGELEVKEATALLVRNYLEVEALPQDLPETFEIDISKFEAIGDAVYVKDLGIDTSKVTINLSEEELEDPIVVVKEVKEEVEEEPAAEAEGESTAEVTTEVEGTEAAQEGETTEESEESDE